MIAAAQVSVHRTPSWSAVRPFVIVLPPDDFARMPTRVVAPLVGPDAMPQLAGEHTRVAPKLAVQGQDCVLNPFDLATLRVHRPGELTASFADDDEAKRRIRDALDIVLKPF
ncbi:MAG TPA: CcdB family protein [Acetobacteraceae bacterium]|nr:CcdB family protein [Acetobacteraceae bacterium]